jgi:hypothetical protein
VLHVGERLYRAVFAARERGRRGGRRGVGDRPHPREQPVQRPHLALARAAQQRVEARARGAVVAGEGLTPRPVHGPGGGAEAQVARGDGHAHRVAPHAATEPGAPLGGGGGHRRAGEADLAQRGQGGAPRRGLGRAAAAPGRGDTRRRAGRPRRAPPARCAARRGWRGARGRRSGRRPRARPRRGRARPRGSRRAAPPEGSPPGHGSVASAAEGKARTPTARPPPRPTNPAPGSSRGEPYHPPARVLTRLARRR